MFNNLDVEDVLIEKYDELLKTKNALQYIRDTLCNAINRLDYEDSEEFDTSILRDRYQTAIDAFEKRLQAVRYLMRKNDLEYDIAVWDVDHVRPSRTSGFFD